MEPEIGPVSLINNDEVQEDLDLLDQLLHGEENRLKTQLENTEQKKSKLSTDLDMFLNQIQGMQNGFSALKQNANRKPSGLVHHQLHLAECHHERGSSLDMMPTSTTTHAPAINGTTSSIRQPSDHSRHASVVW